MSELPTERAQPIERLVVSSNDRISGRGEIAREPVFPMAKELKAR
jgi:hypothetical protein